jgi:hypothetical protein
MAFIPVSVTLSVRATVKNDKVVLPEKLEALALYLSCEDVPPPHMRTPRRRSAPEPTAAEQPRPPKRVHQLNLKEAMGCDGARLKGWSIKDVGSLRDGGDKSPDLRIAKVTFNGAALRSLDNDQERALYGAFLAQETVRLNVLIDDLIEAPLLLKLQLVYGD